MKIKEFVVKMYSSDSSVSSKRVFGSVVLICGIVMGFIYNPNYETFLIVGASMIGLETITKVFSKG